jgi:AraC family transcriptional regulator
LPSQLLTARSARLGPDLAVRAFADPSETTFTLPPTPALAVILVTSGSYVLNTGTRGSRRQAYMSTGSISVTAPGREVHAGWTQGEGAATSHHLHVGAGLLRDVATTFDGRTVDSLDHLRIDDAYVRAAMRTLATTARTGAPQLHRDTVALGLVGHLMLRAPDERRPRRNAPRDADVQAVVDHMRAHLADDLSLADLADVVHLSRSQFLRRFAAATGEPPMRMFTALRMDHARHLLTQTDTDIQQVAFRCGYRDPSAFAAAFRRATGSAPLAFRRGQN